MTARVCEVPNCERPAPERSKVCALHRADREAHRREVRERAKATT